MKTPQQNGRETWQKIREAFYTKVAERCAADLGYTLDRIRRKDNSLKTSRARLVVWIALRCCGASCYEAAVICHRDTSSVKAATNRFWKGDSDPLECVMRRLGEQYPKRAARIIESATEIGVFVGKCVIDECIESHDRYRPKANRKALRTPASKKAVEPDSFNMPKRRVVPVSNPTFRPGDGQKRREEWLAKMGKQEPQTCPSE